MEAFNLNQKCPKCGGDDICTRYHPTVYFSYACSYRDCSHEGDEHLHRYCRRCAYDWCQAPLDAKVEAAES